MARKRHPSTVPDLCIGQIGHGLGSRDFKGPAQLFPMTTQYQPKNNFKGITSQFTLKQTEMQMSTLDSYQYSNNTTILYIGAWERCRPSVWKRLQKKRY